jgi:hypothetical protein
MPEEEGFDGTDWPTTMRFSRRLGDSVRDSRYAMAIEGPLPGRGRINEVTKKFIEWWSNLSARGSGSQAGRL